MRYTAATGYPFDTDNHAYQRLISLSGEHFDTVSWTRDDGRPVLLTLYDLGTGDVLTIAVLDSIEAHDAHALLVVHLDATITAHGPFDGDTAATGHAPTLAMTDLTVAATLALPLHHPSTRHLPPEDAWRPLPPLCISTTPPPHPTTPRTALLLLDRTRQQLAIVGPFPDHTSASRWDPAPELDPNVQTTVVAMHLDPVAAAAIDDHDSGQGDGHE